MDDVLHELEELKARARRTMMDGAAFAAGVDAAVEILLASCPIGGEMSSPDMGES